MVIHPFGSRITPTQIEAFQDALAMDSDLVVEVTVVDRHAEALAALCDSSPTNVTVAWLDGITYQAALAQNCGHAVMQVERGTRPAVTGDAGQIVSARGTGISQIGSLPGRTFCRLGLDDYYSWLVPSLAMRANGIDPGSDLEAVLDFGTQREMIAAVTEGECDAAGISDEDYNDLSGTIRDELNLIETTPPFPFAVLVYPLSLPLGERIRLDNALLAMDINDEGSEAMRPFLGQDGLTRVDETTFEDFMAFLQDTGYDFAQLGS
jgi:ABC-type phosphate/phosphonate transport system substrate-binding protein